MARRGGLFGRLRDLVGKVVDVITPTAPESPAPREPPTDYSGGGARGGDYSSGGGGTGQSDYYPTEVTGVTESDDPPGQEAFPFDFQLAGFLELGATYTQDYVNLEGETVYLEYLPWADMDYFVIQVNEPGRDPYYVTISGSFDDYDDLMAHIAEWWEQGS